ncbi:penicillin-binding protein activator [Litorisediminicola beolgyonensis]|uniref:Penicillin-binding protein activator n=1 Tax=Litorisediminicola beolgyonensis TaxID=1173614 RepID=A0ABW3ZPB4_9RHOB
MFAVFTAARKALTRGSAALAVLALAACDPVAITAGGGGPRVDTSQPVRVALLVPRSDSGAGAIARSLENAARLAIAELGGVQIDLQVYDTAGQAARAAQQAQTAVDNGAQIILGPLFGEAANAAALAVADEGINVLSFSNNATIAGGNLFVLGSTFQNTASRLVRYGTRQNVDDIAVLYQNTTGGALGNQAITQAAARGGARIVASEPYNLNTESLTSALARIAGPVTSGQADALFLTDTWDGGLSVVLQLGPEQGLTPSAVQYMGLSRWDSRTDGFNLPGIEGAWFTVPDRSTQAGFESRYRAAYGAAPHALAGLAFDGINAVGSLIRQGRSDALTGRALTQGSGFQGAGGVFRLLADGSNERALAIATIRNQQVVILDPAPRAFGGAGF